MSVDFNDRAKILAHLTNTFKNITLAVIVETETEINAFPESVEKHLLQLSHPTQRLPIDLGNFSRAASLKLWLRNSILPVLLPVAILLNFNCIEFLNVANLLVFVEV